MLSHNMRDEPQLQSRNDTISRCNRILFTVCFCQMITLAGVLIRRVWLDIFCSETLLFRVSLSKTGIFLSRHRFSHNIRTSLINNRIYAVKSGLLSYPRSRLRTPLPDGKSAAAITAEAEDCQKAVLLTICRKTCIIHWYSGKKRRVTCYFSPQFFELNLPMIQL